MVLGFPMTDINLGKFDGQLHDGLLFCQMVYEFFEQIRRSDGGVSELRMRTSDRVKLLLEELVPICKYVQTKQRKGLYIRVTWVKGNQPFDAKLEQRAAFVERGYEPAEGYIEVTCAVPPNEHLLREAIENGKCAVFEPAGMSRDKETREIRSEPVGRVNSSQIPEFAGFVVGEIAKKAKKKYPDKTSLIVNCVVYVFSACEWDGFVAAVRKRLPQEYAKKFREFFLCDQGQQYCQPL